MPKLSFVNFVDVEEWGIKKFWYSLSEFTIKLNSGLKKMGFVSKVLEFHFFKYQRFSGGLMDH